VNFLDSKKNIKLGLYIFIISIISIVALISTISFFSKEPDDIRAALSIETKQILDSLGDDERVNDFLKAYNLLLNLDITEEKNSNEKVDQVNEITEKWNVEPIKIGHRDISHGSTELIIIHLFYDLIAPVYYEKAPFQKNSLELNIDEITKLFADKDFIYSEEWGDDITQINTKYYKSSELKGPYCSMNYHAKDKEVQSLSFDFFESQRNWSSSQMEEHLNQPFEEQRNDIIDLTLQDLSDYRDGEEDPMLRAVFTAEELEILNWFLDQLDDDQLRQYNIIDTEGHTSFIGLWISANLNDKAFIIGFDLTGIDISIQRRDRYLSEFEKNLHMLQKSFWDEPELVMNENVPDLEELYNSRNITDINSHDKGGSDFIGEWQDSYSQRARMDIEYIDGIYSITINWANSAAENVQWRMTGEFINSEKTGIASYDCTKVLTNSEHGDMTEEVLYEDGEVFLFIENGKLYWSDLTENAGDQCIFEKFN